MKLSPTIMWVNRMFVVLGIILIVFGVIYQVKPDLFKRWFWKRTSIAQKLLSPEAYIKYMKGLGWFYIIAGIVLCVIGFTHS